jgi:hypothetical protein
MRTETCINFIWDLFPEYKLSIPSLKDLEPEVLQIWDFLGIGNFLHKCIKRDCGGRALSLNTKFIFVSYRPYPQSLKVTGYNIFSTSVFCK